MSKQPERCDVIMKLMIVFFGRISTLGYIAAVTMKLKYCLCRYRNVNIEQRCKAQVILAVL